MWCGARNGRSRSSAAPAGSVPATEWIDVHLERLVEIERRQDPRQPPRHHRLSPAGRADQQQVVTAGSGDFERPLRQRLTAHVGEIGSSVEPGCRATASRRSTLARDAHIRRRRPGRSAPEPRRRATDTARTSSPATTAASARVRALAGADAARPSRRAATAIGSTPRIGWIEPSSDSSPSSTSSVDVAPLDHAAGGENAERDRQVERGARLCARRPAPDSR